VYDGYLSCNDVRLLDTGSCITLLAEVLRFIGQQGVIAGTASCVCTQHYGVTESANVFRFHGVAAEEETEKPCDRASATGHF
jgi:hypothetical protein